MAQETYDYVVRDIVSAARIGRGGLVVTLTGVEEAPLRIYFSVDHTYDLLLKWRDTTRLPQDYATFETIWP